MQKSISRVGVFASMLTVALLSYACGVERTLDDATRVTQQNDLARGIVCTNVAIAGSSIREKRCTTPEQREAEQRAAERVLAPPDYSGRRRAGM